MCFLLQVLCIGLLVFCETLKFERQIIAGTEIDRDEVPWQMLLNMQLGTQTFMCGGSLIDPSWVVTAAHCTDGYAADDIKIIATSSLRQFVGSSNTRTAAAKFEHPQWDTVRTQWDIALIQLDHPFTVGGDIQTIPLLSPNRSSLYEAGDKGMVSGFGQTESTSNTELHQVVVQVWSQNDLTQQLGFIRWHSSWLAVGGDVSTLKNTGNPATCFGDSGGPFVVSDTTSPVGYSLVGAVSWGIEGSDCGTDGPSVMALLPPEYEWINKQCGACLTECTEQCSGVCVNKQTDTTNCGTCGNQCTQGETCAAGQCVCGGKRQRCGGECLQVLSNANNCGTCGNQCEAPSVCSAGSCMCPQGYELCNDKCTNIFEDENNCGSCGERCPLNAVCSLSFFSVGCHCPNSHPTLCGDMCTNRATDINNCGSCGNTCNPFIGEECIEGECKVCTDAIKSLQCDQQCFDPLTSNQHCGACGVSCPHSLQCTNGVCISETTQCETVNNNPLCPSWNSLVGPLTSEDTQNSFIQVYYVWKHNVDIWDFIGCRSAVLDAACLINAQKCEDNPNTGLSYGVGMCSSLCHSLRQQCGNAIDLLHYYMQESNIGLGLPTSCTPTNDGLIVEDGTMPCVADVFGTIKCANSSVVQYSWQCSETNNSGEDEDDTGVVPVDNPEECDTKCLRKGFNSCRKQCGNVPKNQRTDCKVVCAYTHKQVDKQRTKCIDKCLKKPKPIPQQRCIGKCHATWGQDPNSVILTGQPGECKFVPYIIHLPPSQIRYLKGM